MNFWSKIFACNLFFFNLLCSVSFVENVLETILENLFFELSDVVIPIAMLLYPGIYLIFSNTTVVLHQILNKNLLFSFKVRMFIINVNLLLILRGIWLNTVLVHELKKLSRHFSEGFSCKFWWVILVLVEINELDDVSSSLFPRWRLQRSTIISV